MATRNSFTERYLSLRKNPDFVDYLPGGKKFILHSEKGVEIDFEAAKKSARKFTKAYGKVLRK